MDLNQDLVVVRRRFFHFLDMKYIGLPGLGVYNRFLVGFSSLSNIVLLFHGDDYFSSGVFIHKIPERLRNLT